MSSYLWALSKNRTTVDYDEAISLKYIHWDCKFRECWVPIKENDASKCYRPSSSSRLLCNASVWRGLRHADDCRHCHATQRTHLLVVPYCLQHVPRYRLLACCLPVYAPTWQIVDLDNGRERRKHVSGVRQRIFLKYLPSFLSLTINKLNYKQLQNTFCKWKVNWYSIFTNTIPDESWIIYN